MRSSKAVYKVNSLASTLMSLVALKSGWWDVLVVSLLAVTRTLAKTNALTPPLNAPLVQRGAFILLLFFTVRCWYVFARYMPFTLHSLHSRTLWYPACEVVCLLLVAWTIEGVSPVDYALSSGLVFPVRVRIVQSLYVFGNNLMWYAVRRLQGQHHKQNRTRIRTRDPEIEIIDAELLEETDPSVAHFHSTKRLKSQEKPFLKLPWSQK